MPFLTQIPRSPENLRYGKLGSVTVGVGGSALVTGDVSTGSGGGGGAATVEVGSCSVDTGRAPAAVVTVSTACVTCVVALVAVFAAVVTACATGVLDGRAVGADAAETGVTSATDVPPSGWAPGALPAPSAMPDWNVTAARDPTAPSVTTKLRPCRLTTTIGPRSTRVAAAEVTTLAP